MLFFLFLLIGEGDGCNRVARSPAPIALTARCIFPCRKSVLPGGAFPRLVVLICPLCRSPDTRGVHRTAAVGLPAAQRFEALPARLHVPVRQSSSRRWVVCDRFPFLGSRFASRIRRRSSCCGLRWRAVVSALCSEPGRAVSALFGAGKVVFACVVVRARADPSVCRLSFFPSAGPTWRRRVSGRAGGGASRRRVASVGRRAGPPLPPRVGGSVGIDGDGGGLSAALGLRGESGRGSARAGVVRRLVATVARRAECAWQGDGTSSPSGAPDWVTWLILPVVICLSQRLSHACPSMNASYCETANGSLNQL